METSVNEPLMKRREVSNDVKTNRSPLGWDKFGSNLITDPSGVRRADGVNLVQALIRNVGTSRLGVKGETQAVDTVRVRVPILGTGTEQLVVAMKPVKAGGAKGLCHSALVAGQLFSIGGANE